MVLPRNTVSKFVSQNRQVKQRSDSIPFSSVLNSNQAANPLHVYRLCHTRKNTNTKSEKLSKLTVSKQTPIFSVTVHYKVHKVAFAHIEKVIGITIVVKDK